MIVMKFGGTSVKDAVAMSQSANIVTSQSAQKPIVVLSACSGITNKLVQLSTAIISNHKFADTIIAEIIEHHRTVVRELSVREEIRTQLQVAVEQKIEEFTTFLKGITLLKECTPRSTDTLLSFGEFFSTTIFTYLLQNLGIKAVFVSAKDCIKTTRDFGRAIVDYEASKQSILQIIPSILEKTDCIVTQGFVGSFEGITTTLGRGGSDFSAAVFGYALSTKEIQIWTDVSGVYTTDPRMVPSATTIPQLTFDEIRDLSVYGAKVLHPETILPAVKSSIPVKVLNTFRPEDKGTVIHTIPMKSIGKAKAVSALKQCLTFSIFVPIEQESEEVLHQIIPKLQKEGIPIFILTLTESCIQFTTNVALEDVLPLLQNVKYLFHKTSLLCVLIESQLSTRSSIIKSIESFDILQVSINSSEHSIVVICKEEDTVPIVTAIHATII